MSDEAKAPEEEVKAEPGTEPGTEPEAEPEGEGEGEAALPTGLKGKLMANLKLVIIAVVALVVVGGGGAGIYLSGIFHTENPREAVVMLPAPPVDQEMQRVTVDLKPSPKHPRPFIRMTMRAELQGESARAAFLANETKIMDAIHTALRDTTVEDLQGEAGTERLRTDITTIINRIIAPEVAITVLYQDLIIR